MRNIAGLAPDFLIWDTEIITKWQEAGGDYILQFGGKNIAGRLKLNEGGLTKLASTHDNLSGGEYEQQGFTKGIPRIQINYSADGTGDVDIDYNSPYDIFMHLEHQNSMITYRDHYKKYKAAFGDPGFSSLEISK